MKYNLIFASLCVAILSLSACARRPAAAPPASTAAAPSQTAAAPTAWKTFQDKTQSIAFEYPAVYDEAAHTEQCSVRKTDDGVGVGIRIELAFVDPGGKSLDDYATTLVKSKEWNETSRATATVGGQPALTVEYRFGGTNRYGTFTLVSNGDKTLAFNFSAGAFCDFPEANVTELDAYHHLIESFQFLP